MTENWENISVIKSKILSKLKKTITDDFRNIKLAHSVRKETVYKHIYSLKVCDSVTAWGKW